MSNKAEISWKRRTEDGARLEIYAHHVGDRWMFYSRERRVGQYTEFKKPLLEDWLALLDSIRRRAGRRLLPPEEVKRMEKTIRERFPEASV